MAELTIDTSRVTGPSGAAVLVAEVGGAIDGSTVRGFDEQLNSFYDKGHRQLVLNFRDVKYINSTGMGLMVKVADRFAESGGELHLAEVSKKIRDLFDMLGLLSLFSIHDSTRDAVDSIAANGASAEAAEPEAAVEAVPDAMDAFELEDGLGFDATPVEEAIEAGSVEFPFDWTCAGCEGLVELPGPGAYQCPRCRIFLQVSAEGQVTDYAALAPHTLELRLPCAGELLAHIDALTRSFASMRQLPAQFIDELLGAIATICEIVREKAAPSDTLQVMVVASRQQMILGFRPSHRAFTDGGQGGDPRLRQVANRVDRIELFPLSSQGELLKVVKRHQS